MTIDLAGADKLLTTTRAVRKRMDFDRPVERSVIEQAVEIALQAPTYFPVDFIVVTDPDRRKQMSDLYCDAHLPYLDELVAEAKADLGGEEAAQAVRHLEMIRWATENMYRVPVHVHIGAKGIESHGKYQASFYGNILPSAWSFMLALRARGVGSSWTTIHLQEPYKERVQKLFELPDDYALGAFLPCGHYTGEDFKPAVRRSAAKSIRWEQY